MTRPDPMADDKGRVFQILTREEYETDGHIAATVTTIRDVRVVLRTLLKRMDAGEIVNIEIHNRSAFDAGGT